MRIKSVLIATIAVVLLTTTAASARPFQKHRAVSRASSVIECNQQGCADRSVLPKTRSRSLGGSPSFFSGGLVSEARRYMGTNPTRRGRQWCGAFMDLILKNTGHAGGGNLARAYARYGTRVKGPQVGAIAVMNHHVGVVSGIDANGNPIIVSGNHNRTVAEAVYSRSRIIAYVVPN